MLNGIRTAIPPSGSYPCLFQARIPESHLVGLPVQKDLIYKSPPAQRGSAPTHGADHAPASTLMSNDRENSCRGRTIPDRVVGRVPSLSSLRCDASGHRHVLVVPLIRSPHWERRRPCGRDVCGVGRSGPVHAMPGWRSSRGSTRRSSRWLPPANGRTTEHPDRADAHAYRDHLR